MQEGEAPERTRADETRTRRSGADAAVHAERRKARDRDRAWGAKHPGTDAEGTGAKRYHGSVGRVGNGAGRRGAGYSYLCGTNGKTEERDRRGRTGGRGSESPKRIRTDIKRQPGGNTKRTRYAGRMQNHPGTERKIRKKTQSGPRRLLQKTDGNTHGRRDGRRRETEKAERKDRTARRDADGWRETGPHGRDRNGWERRNDRAKRTEIGESGGKSGKSCEKNCEKIPIPI